MKCYICCRGVLHGLGQAARLQQLGRLDVSQAVTAVLREVEHYLVNNLTELERAGSGGKAQEPAWLLWIVWRSCTCFKETLLITRLKAAVCHLKELEWRGLCVLLALRRVSLTVCYTCLLCCSQTDFSPYFSGCYIRCLSCWDGFSCPVYLQAEEQHLCSLYQLQHGIFCRQIACYMMQHSMRDYAVSICCSTFWSLHSGTQE